MSRQRNKKDCLHISTAPSSNILNEFTATYSNSNPAFGRLIPCHGWKCVKERRSADGNLVNVGNFDANGANVNNWKPDNVNDNLGVSFSRSLYQNEPCWFVLVSFIQPPSIRPISTSAFSRVRYFFWSSALTS